MTKANYNDDDITLEEWMDGMDKVVDAYAHEVGIMRQFNRSVENNLANLNARVKILEEERASYEASIRVPDESDE